jgi:hypothetical protein
MVKYPKTPHLEGSKIQSGDEVETIKFASILGKNIVIEEKVDGANVGVSFSEGRLLLQSRGHYLSGGGRERHYDLFKVWAAERRDELYSVLGEKFIMYGEWLHPKHKVYYDALPDYFLEFDIFDKQTGKFLDTTSRKAMLNGTSIKSVPLLFNGKSPSKNKILSYLTRSTFISENAIKNLEKTCACLSLDFSTVLAETDTSPLMEGLYVKVEEDGIVKMRVKFVRSSYTQPNNDKWLSKPIIPNKLNEKA